MLKVYRYKGATWLDLNNPTKEDISEVYTTYKIDRHIADELLVPVNKSSIQFYNDIIYLSLCFPAFKHSHTKEKTDQEIGFVIGKDKIITSRLENIDALNTFSKIIETESVIDKDEVHDSAEFIFFKMIHELYEAVSHELAFVDSWTDEIESKVFKGKEKEMVRSLSDVGRVLIDFKKTLMQHQEILESLRQHGLRTSNEHFTFHANELLSDYEKLKHTLESQHEIVSELRETNNALLNTEQSEIAKVVTVLAFIAVPISLFIGILQIDTKSRPIIGMDNDFWILIVLVGLIGALMFAFFKYEKWL